MKKTRNTFFQESAYQSYNPNMNSPFGAPYQTAGNFFYQGPMPNNYNTMDGTNDIESRIAKIERQLNRIDYRLTKLENASNISLSEDIDNNTTNMYML